MKLTADKYNGFIRISVMAAVLLIPALMYWNNPNIDEARSICPFMRFLNFPCPGCGLTKSMIHAYKGDFAISLQYNIWGIPLILIICSLITLQTYDIIGHHRHTDNILSKAALWQAVAFMVVLTYLIRIIIHFA